MTPIPFTWSGSEMVPKRAFAKLCDKQFVVGSSYVMETMEPRSAASHAHFFATINDMHANLPEHLVERWPTSESLRKYALIMSGFCDVRTYVASSKAEASRIAAFIRPTDTDAIVTVKDATVTVLTAHSQSMKAMGKEQFQKSKQSVLDVINEILGVNEARAA